MSCPRFVFAESRASAAAILRRHPNARLATPRSPSALARAAGSGALVLVVAPRRRSAAWSRACRRFLLPSAPGLLRAAISGIARTHDEDLPATTDTSSATRALLVEGRLTDKRAAELLADRSAPRLWIVEDYRAIAVGDATLDRIGRRKIRLAALRSFRVARRHACV